MLQGQGCMLQGQGCMLQGQGSGRGGVYVAGAGVR